jgi:hypothetical protein
MIEVNFDQIFAIPAEDASILTGVEAEKFTQPGIYHVLIGSRGEPEEFEFIGEVKSVMLPTKEELMAKAEDEFERDMIEEFYGVGIEDDHINFGYTEEGYDVFLRI